MLFKRLVSLGLSAAIALVAPGLAPYEALGQVRGGRAAVEFSAPALGALPTFDAPGIDTGLRLSLDAGLTLELQAAPSTALPESLDLKNEHSPLARIASPKKEKREGAVASLYDGSKTKKASGSDAGVVVADLGAAPALAAARMAAPASAASAGVPDPSEESDHEVDGLRPSYLLEGVLEDFPRPRDKAVEILTAQAVPASEKERFWSDAEARFQEAVTMEGFPREDLTKVVDFLDRVAGEEEVPEAIRDRARRYATSLDLESEALRTVRSEADRQGLLNHHAEILLDVVRQDEDAIRSEARFALHAQAIADLEARGITPVASLVRGVVRSADRAGAWLGWFPALKVRAKKKAREDFLKKLERTMRELETREPDPYDDNEVRLFYSVAAKRTPIQNGYYGYRKRVNAARDFARRAGLKREDWVAEKGFGAFDLEVEYKPFDTTKVDRVELARQVRDMLAAYERHETLALFDDPVLAPVRADLVSKAWAYLKLWSEIEGTEEARTPDGNAKPIPGKKIKGYLKRSEDVSEKKMLADLYAGGKMTAIALHAALSLQLQAVNQMSKQLKGAENAAERAALQATMPKMEREIFDNAFGLQWRDEITRMDLKVAGKLDAPETWTDEETYWAAKRLNATYLNKFPSFFKKETGFDVTSGVQQIIASYRTPAKDQLANVYQPAQAGKTETVALRPSYGVSGLLRGFCGADCSKSLSRERGGLLYRAMDPHSVVYTGYVDGVGVGYVQMMEARKDGEKVLLIEVIQFLGREGMTTKLLAALDAEAKRRGYIGVAVPDTIWPTDKASNQEIHNYSNYLETVQLTKAFAPYQTGEVFTATFERPDVMARLDKLLGTVPYYSFNIPGVRYKLLRFDGVIPADVALERAKTGEAPGAKLQVKPGKWITNEPAREGENPAKWDILNGYFKGQLAHVARFAMYYSLFTPLVKAMFGAGNPMGESAVGASRTGYSWALAFFAPVAGVLAEKFSTRRILLATSAIRFAIWSGLIPAAFVALGPSGAFLAAFVALNVLDGAVVSVNTLVDGDRGGFNLLADQYGFEMDSQTRTEYNALKFKWYNYFQVFLPTGMAVLGVVAAQYLASAAGIMIAIMGGTFGVASVLTLYYYAKYLPKDAKVEHADKSVKASFANLWEGWKMVRKEKRVKARMFFTALERAIDDAMLFFVLPGFSLGIIAPAATDLFFPGAGAATSTAVAALATAALIAVSRLGSAVASQDMQKNWKAPAPDEPLYNGYKHFFPMAFYGRALTLLLPVAAFLASAGGAAGLTAAILIAGGVSFLFGRKTQQPRIAFNNLMQKIAGEMGASGRIFGINNLVVWLVNGVLIWAVAALFSMFNLAPALALSTVLFTAAGLFEFLWGPKVLFTKEELGE